MRGSDPQAALYYLARMLVAGEEPLYVLRRITRFARRYRPRDPRALVQCLAAKDAYEFLGSPKASSQSSKPASIAPPPPNRTLPMSRRRPPEIGARTGSLMPPQNILNAPTQLMKDIGYGKGYAYDMKPENGFSGDNYWPEEIGPQNFYVPSSRGFESKIAERLAYWKSSELNARGDWRIRSQGLMIMRIARARAQRG